MRFSHFLVISLISATVPFVDAQPINIPDDNLREAVKQSLGIDHDPNEAEMLQLAQVGGRGIASLVGLEYALNLTRLQLYNNNTPISDLSPISGLTNLERLALEGCGISDILPLSHLENLKVLALSQNDIRDISALANMANLRDLACVDNRISEIDPLAGLTDLERVNLLNNQVSDISSLSNLVNLKTLELSDNQITDLSALAGLVALELITLHNNQVNDISDLSSLTHLETLYLGANQVSDISALSNCRNLVELYMSNNQIDNTSALVHLAELRDLSLAGNLIDSGDLTSLSGLKNLENLDLRKNQIDDISALGGLTNLRRLRLATNHIGDISTLTNSTAFTVVDLRENQLGGTAYDVHIPEILANNPGVELFYDDPKGLSVGLVDVNLKAAVEEALGIQNPNVYDIQELTYLSARDRGITDLTGLEYALNLRVLELGNNSISDLSPINGLSSLEYLYLDNNLIVNVSSLSTLTNLLELTLGNNQITDVSALSALTNMLEMNLGNNQISDISALSAMTNLTYLNLWSNQVSDVSPLAGLVKLKHLYIDQNRISDISAFSGLMSLEGLWISRNQISDLSPISNLVDLRGLGLTANQVDDVTPLAGLTNLEDLILTTNRITDISPLASLTRLWRLRLNYNDISDVSALSGLTALEELVLDVTEISDISALSGLIELKRLNLAYIGQISDIAALANLTKLEWLDLRRNMVSDISSLSGLVNLTYLNLGDNQIVDVGPLAELINLNRLELYANQINDISALAGLTDLHDLQLQANQIGDISSLSGLVVLETLVLYKNQISDVSALSGLVNLKDLRLNDNQIRNVSPLANLKKLTFLDLFWNQVRDISPLADLGELTHLDLRSNPLHVLAHDIHIPQILLNNPGIELLYDDPIWWQLTVDSTAGGHVTTPGEGTFVYLNGSVVEIEAAQTDVNAVFTGWSGTAVETGKVADPTAMLTTLRIDNDYSVQAVFAESPEGPALGLDLGQVVTGDPEHFDARVVNNNTPETTFVELVPVSGTDPNVVMQMNTIDDQPAQAKGHFGRSQADRVLIHFAYLFQSTDVELVVYLSDREIVGDRDPLHSIEVDRISAPRAGRPGSVGSGQWAAHEVWQEVSGLDLSQGTWVELVLEPIDPVRSVQTFKFSGLGRRFETFAVATSSVQIDDWGMEVHCDDSHCNDVTKDQYTDWQDFWVLKAAHGRETGLPSGTTVSRCFEGGFCVDGYVDVYDHFSLDWIIENESRMGHLCGSLPPLTGWEPVGAHGMSLNSMVTFAEDFRDAVLSPGLMMLGKGYVSGSYRDFIDHLYHLSENQAYILPYNYTNMRLVYGADGEVYLLNSRDGLVDTSGNPVLYEDSFVYGEGQTVTLGVRWQGTKPAGLPVLDACVTTDSVYVTPVIVEPDGGVPYAASARISRTSHQVEQLYHDGEWFNPDNLGNPYAYGLREIELDDAGNLYALNVHALNNSTMLWKYDGSGQVLVEGSGQTLEVTDPLALHYCVMDQRLYVASGLLRSFDTDATLIYQLMEESGRFMAAPIAAVPMQHVTSMASDDEGSLWVAGFAFEGAIPQEIRGNTRVDYSPKLVRLPLSRETVENIDLSDHGAGEVGYPTSLIWVK